MSGIDGASDGKKEIPSDIKAAGYLILMGGICVGFGLLSVIGVGGIGIGFGVTFWLLGALLAFERFLGQ